VITKLKKIDNTAGVAFATPDTRRELLRKILVEVKSKAWTQEEEIYRTEQ
jgi:DNA excision repair protein ERCC-3